MKFPSNRIALCALLAVLFLDGFVRAFEAFHGAEPSARYSLLSAFALIWAAVWWFTEESKRQAAGPVSCGSVLLLTISWPLVVGYYALSRRGLRGVSVILVMFGAFISGIFAAMIASAALF